MHEPDLTKFDILIRARRNWWQLSILDLEEIPDCLIGKLPGGWVRKGNNFVRIANLKFGSDARKLKIEIAALNRLTAEIRKNYGKSADFLAAIFYHLRFENIHPLVEGNGRIGRLILSMQLQESYGFRPNNLLAGFCDWQADYYSAFRIVDENLRIEVFVDLICRITGMEIQLRPDFKFPTMNPLHEQKAVENYQHRVHPETILRSGQSQPNPQK